MRLGPACILQTFGGIYSLSAAPVIGKELESIKEMTRELLILCIVSHFRSEELLGPIQMRFQIRFFKKRLYLDKQEALAFHYLLQDHLHYDDIYDFKLKNAKSKDVTKSLRDNINLENPVLTLLIPKDSELSEKIF